MEDDLIDDDYTSKQNNNTFSDSLEDDE